MVRASPEIHLGLIMTNRQHLLLSLVAAGTLGVAAPVVAQVQGQNGQSVIDQNRTDERLDRLENALRDLQGVVYSVEERQNGITRVPVSYVGTPGVADTAAAATVGQATALPPGSEATFSIRLNAIESALAELTGQVEEMRFKLDRQQDALDRLGSGAGGSSSGGVAPLGLPAFDGAAPISAPGSAPVDASGGPTDLVSGEAPTAPAASAIVVNLPDDPRSAYEVAYDSVLAADYPRAEAAFKAYIEKFPSAEQTPDAKFLLGEVYLATGANSDAARVFLDHVSSYDNDPRSPEAYLKLGIAFSRLDRPDEACRVCRAGTKKDPSMSGPLKRQYSDEAAKAGCS